MKLTQTQAIILLFAAAGLAAFVSVPTYDWCVAGAGSGWLVWVACPLGAAGIATAIMAAIAVPVLLNTPPMRIE